jgi:hypothetical protein
MTIKKSPGAVEAAHRASETDELGWRVRSENSLLAQLTQAAQRGGPSVQHATLNGAGEFATNAKPVAEKSQTDALRIVIRPTRSGRKRIARLGDGFARKGFANSVRHLSAIIDLLSAALAAATPVATNNEQAQAPTRSVNGGVA